MKKIANMKLRAKFIMTLVIITILIVLLDAMAFRTFLRMNGSMNEFANTEYANTEAELSLRKDIQTVNKRLLLVMYKSDMYKVGDVREDYDTRIETMRSNMAIVSKHLDDKELVEKLNKEFDEFETGATKILNYVGTGRTEKAIAYYDQTFDKSSSEAFVATLQEVGKKSDAMAKERIAYAEKTRTETMIELGAIGALIIILTAIIFYLLSKRILKNVKIASSTMDQLASGNFEVEIDESKIDKDEIGMMLASMSVMTENWKALVTEVNRILTQMSQGNFVVDIKNPEIYVGDTQTIREGFETIADNLTDILANMNQVATQVNAGSQQIAGASLELSQGATEQASTLEEIAATVEGLNHRIHENAQQADHVRDYAIGVADQVTIENEQMQQVQAAMNDIEDKSNKIEHIIKIIEDIAFQTNILALNAAVEAARAGESGKGFAVVADEVRSLAGKAATSAVETSELIESAIHAIHRGTGLVESAAASLEEVKDKAVNSQELVATIAKEMEDQAKSISEIATGLDQISGVTQNNSSTAEESSASSEELSSLSKVLKDMVSKMKYREAQLHKLTI